MRKQLYGASIQPACAICRQSRRDIASGGLYCALKNTQVSLTDDCRKFNYDPILRGPAPVRHIPLPEAERFTLE